MYIKFPNYMQMDKNSVELCSQIIMIRNRKSLVLNMMLELVFKLFLLKSNVYIERFIEKVFL
jgi:hypothetical protein